MMGNWMETNRNPKAPLAQSLAFTATTLWPSLIAFAAVAYGDRSRDGCQLHRGDRAFKRNRALAKK